MTLWERADGFKTPAGNSITHVDGEDRRPGVRSSIDVGLDKYLGKIEGLGSNLALTDPGHGHPRHAEQDGDVQRDWQHRDQERRDGHVHLQRERPGECAVARTGEPDGGRGQVLVAAWQCRTL